MQTHPEDGVRHLDLGSVVSVCVLSAGGWQTPGAIWKAFYVGYSHRPRAVWCDEKKIQMNL